MAQNSCFLGVEVYDGQGPSGKFMVGVVSILK